MKTANDFLKEKGIIKEGYSKWICKFEDGSEFDIGDLMQAYADQQVKAEREKVLNDAIEKVRLDRRIYGSAQTYDAIIGILEKLKIKQP